jgi:hypothetical protein
MLTKERRSLWFDKLTNRLSKRRSVAGSGTFDWFVRHTNRRLVSRSNHSDRANDTAYFVDHFLFVIQGTQSRAAAFTPKGDRHNIINLSTSKRRKNPRESAT